jgi:acetyl esterase/lipase
MTTPQRLGLKSENHRRVYPKVQTALQDAQRTLRLLRQHAAQWHVDPHKVGVIGFSAGGHLVAAVSLRPDILVRADSPPTFLVQAEDDHVDGVEQSLAYYVALQKAGAPTEMHLYAQGGHAFGLRTSKLPIAQWPRLVETRLGTMGMADAALAR